MLVYEVSYWIARICIVVDPSGTNEDRFFLLDRACNVEIRYLIYLDNLGALRGENYIKTDHQISGSDTTNEDETCHEKKANYKKGRTDSEGFISKKTRGSIGNFAERRLCHYADHLVQDLHHVPSQLLGQGGKQERKEGARLTSAAAMVVNSAFVSYAGATSTISAETMKRPSSPRKIVRSSRVDQPRTCIDQRVSRCHWKKRDVPPVSGVPVAGANAGSIESICSKCASD